MNKVIPVYEDRDITPPQNDVTKLQLLYDYSSAIHSLQYFESLGITLNITKPYVDPTPFQQIATIALVSYTRSELENTLNVELTPVRYRDAIKNMLTRYIISELPSNITSVMGVPVITNSTTAETYRRPHPDKLSWTPPINTIVLKSACIRAVSPYGLGDIVVGIYHKTFDFDELYSARHDIKRIATMLSELKVHIIHVHDYDTAIPIQLMYSNTKQGYKVLIDAPNYTGHRETIIAVPDIELRKRVTNYIVDKK